MSLWSVCLATDPYPLPHTHLSLRQAIFPTQNAVNFPATVCQEVQTDSSVPCPTPPQILWLEQQLPPPLCCGQAMLYFCAKLKNKLVSPSASIPFCPLQYLMAGGHAFYSSHSMKGCSHTGNGCTRLWVPLFSSLCCSGVVSSWIQHQPGEE